MNKQTKRKEFIEFLKKHDALVPFLNNIYKGSWISTFSELIKKESPFDWVMNAFLWEPTTEGRDYWSDLNYKWRLVIL